jgi:hypothetical protein
MRWRSVNLVRIQQRRRKAEMRWRRSFLCGGENMVRHMEMDMTMAIVMAEVMLGEATEAGYRRMNLTNPTGGLPCGIG